MTQTEALRLALEALESASYAIESWGSYASEYFQDKHDLQGDINNTQQAITAIKAALEAKDEPVAWMRTSGTGSPVVTEELLVAMPEMRWNFQQPLYTTPPQRKPLDEKELEKLWDEATDHMEHFCSQYWDFARAIEAAHGIKGEA